MVVFAKLISQPLPILYSTPGRGRCVKDHPRLLSGVGWIYSTPARGRFVKDYFWLLSEVAVLVFAKFILVYTLQRLYSTPATGHSVSFAYSSLYVDYLQPLTKVVRLKPTISSIIKAVFSVLLTLNNSY